MNHVPVIDEIDGLKREHLESEISNLKEQVSRLQEERERLEMEVSRLKEDIECQRGNQDLRRRLSSGLVTADTESQRQQGVQRR